MKYSIENIRLVPLGILLSFVLWGLTGCCTSPWNRFPISTPPDRSCRTSGAAGYDVYVWTCLQEQHIVIYQFSGEFSCEEPQKETSTCGSLTPIEQKLKQSIQENCHPVPRTRAWPT